MKSRKRRSARGFTLIEVAVATMIVGVGITALLVAVGANTRVNGYGAELTEATFLAQELHEWTSALPFSDPDPEDANNPPGPDGSDPQPPDDLDDLMGVTYSPPRDGEGYELYGMSGWSQTITLTWRDPNALTQTVADGASDVIHVQVDIGYKGRTILINGWFAARR